MTAKRKPRETRAAESPPVEEMTFEAALERLEALVERLEEGKISLDESLSAYVEGTRLVQRCQERLAHAEAVIRELSEGPDGFELRPSSLSGLAGEVDDEDDEDDGDEDDEDGEDGEDGEDEEDR